MASLLAKKLFDDDSFNFRSPLKQCDDAEEDNSFSPMMDYFSTKGSSSFVAEDEDSRDSGIGLDDSFSNDDCPLSLPSRPFVQLNKVCEGGKIHSQNIRKRSRSQSDQDDSPVQKRKRPDAIPEPSKCPLRLSNLHSEHEIKTALDRVSENPDLISDGSVAYCLPTIPGKHQDLKSITPETLARLQKHEFDDIVDEFLIVDCRYPYEFQGGHIKGAVNYYTKDSIVENLISKPVITRSSATKRSILIFHCEFSSQRGPKMSRFLRSQDRQMNKDRYPQLCYPEIYLLHGGYKNFFEKEKELCTPQTYLPMHHEDFKKDMRTFRCQSKSWAGEKKTRSALRLFL
ncbi:M-phase inducer phosphatase 1-like [Liolophura sinensis]|uniref:M-phase inducer phosphatase 1-like n=1 Tax=Liolophura sinensis TaxID=3198878 RepID=UPI003159611F